MVNKYRVDWQAGMRLTDETFRMSDEYYLSYLQPLYAALVNGDYGFLELPIFRYEQTETSLSVTELQANAISRSGKLIQLSFSREERSLFQNIRLPETTEPLILFLDKTSDKTVKVSCNDTSVPLCDADYQLFAKLESEHYNNPDAVPFARFVYRHGWSMDEAFVAPCISLRSNGALLRAAANYAVEIEALVSALKDAVNTEQYTLVMAAIPALCRIAIEVEKEADCMTPRHLITLMQEGIQVLLTLANMEKDITIPETEKCMAFVESHYTPYVISEMIHEGIRLTHLLISLPQLFRQKTAVVAEARLEPEVVRPPRRIMGSTDSIRKKHH